MSKHGALLISDEVICGFGRTGKAFGFMNYDVKPDIITMAKGITSAYLPLSATAVKKYMRLLKVKENMNFSATLIHLVEIQQLVH